MNDISWAAEVHDHGHGAACESFEDYGCTIVANRWKHEHISRSHARQDFGTADRTTKVDSLLDLEGFNQFLKAVSQRSITDDCETGHTASQQWSGCAQCEITSLPRNQAANKNQFQFGTGLRTARVTETVGTTYAGFRDEKQFVAKRGKLGIGLGGSGYNRGCVAIRGPSKRQEPVEIPKARNPLFLVLDLTKTRRPRQTAIEGADHKGYRPFAEKEGEGAWNAWRHRHEAKNNVELPRKDAASELAPSLPFKAYRKRIAERGHHLTLCV